MMVAAGILQLLGITAQAYGVLCMANLLLGHVRTRQVLHVLASALWFGKLARGATLTAIWPEKPLLTLHGISAIVAGFLLQAVGTAVPLLVPA